MGEAFGVNEAVLVVFGEGVLKNVGMVKFEVLFERCSK